MIQNHLIVFVIQILLIIRAVELRAAQNVLVCINNNLIGNIKPYLAPQNFVTTFLLYNFCFSY